MWICPTLGRPERLQTLAKSWPIRRPLFVVLTRDDDRLGDYLRADYPSEWRLEVCDERFLTPKLNWAFNQLPNAQFYGFVADDIRVDGSLVKLETLAESWFISYPDDTIHGSRLCTHFCLGGDLAREMGWIAHPDFKHYYIDRVWMLLGKANSIIRYAPDVTFFHDHPVKDAAWGDEVYNVTMGKWWTHDTNQWEVYMRDRAKQDALKIASALRRAFK